ncbi:MAG TPA: zinc-binding dehydrogenase [Fluviicola sp.]|nr:zinc-binding dehydrogenase [Fluviicola sp.]
METTAFVLTKKGDATTAFSLQTVQLPDLKEQQVCIKVEAFGLNYADVMARRGLYREAPPMPCVIGYEVVGMIESVGTKVSRELIGTRVVGFCRFGGYAQHVITEEHAVAPIGEMDAAEALALATQFVTAHYMVERTANVQSGERILIHAAAGGVGTALIQLCKRKNALVCAKIGSRNKEKTVRDLGADEVVIYSEQPYWQSVQNWLGHHRLDVSFNPVAGSTFKRDFALLGAGGRMVLFGGSELSGTRWGIFSALNFVWKMGFVIPIGLMMRSKAVIGVNMLKVADFKPEVLTQCLTEVVSLAKAGEIKPIVGERFQQDDFSLAHNQLESGTTIGKLAVFWNQ